MPKSHGRRPLVIGLTGGIASGKSTVARMLADRGAAIVDADELARLAVSPGSDVLQAIVAEFGEGVLREDGTLDRDRMGRRVFADAHARERLERLIHPRISEMAETRVRELGEAGASIVFYEAALLVEKNLQASLDGLLVVVAPPTAQIERAIERDGVSEAEVKRRMAAQLPLERKLEVADWVIDNSGPLAKTERQVDEFWRRIRDSAKSGKLVDSKL